MARILILQEIPGPLLTLRRCLEPHHELVFVKEIDEALQILLSTKIDLIICRVHLEDTSIFEFIKVVKQDPRFSGTPFICFCGRKTKFSRSLDDVLSKAAEQIGADRYLSLDEEDCDVGKLRGEIESCLTLKT